MENLGTVYAANYFRGYLKFLFKMFRQITLLKHFPWGLSKIVTATVMVLIDKYLLKMFVISEYAQIMNL